MIFGGSARINDVLLSLPDDLVAVTGTVSVVEYTGLMLGGSYGPLNSHFGLVCDLRSHLGGTVVMNSMFPFRSRRAAYPRTLALLFLAVGLFCCVAPGQVVTRRCMPAEVSRPDLPEKRIVRAHLFQSSTSASDRSSLQFGPYMREGKWSFLFTTSFVSERGVFFFRNKPSGPSLVSIWGGVAAGDSANSIAEWTKQLSPNFPPRLAQCFAQAVLNGQ